MLIKKDSLRGVAALITVISLGSLVFVISLSTAIVTFWSIKNIDANQKGMIAYYAAYSGIQDALIKLERNKDFSGEYNLSINNENDVSVIVSNTGESVTIYSEAVSGQIYKRIETTADIDSTTGLIVPVRTEEIVISAITTTTTFGTTTTITTTTTTTTVPPCDENVTFTYKGTQVTYGVVYNSVTGRCWMDRNLGASRVAQSYDDSEAYGDLFQWGRLDDGHQVRTSSMTPTLATSDTPGHDNFIKNVSSPYYDWRDPQNDNLWQGVNGINNPCPEGWRIPTKTEWENERLQFPTNDSAGAYNSVLKLTVGGLRGGSYGLLDDVGSSGRYWSSSVSGTNAQDLFFYSSGAGMGNHGRDDGRSVRCVQD